MVDVLIRGRSPEVHLPVLGGGDGHVAAVDEYDVEPKTCRIKAKGVFPGADLGRDDHLAADQVILTDINFKKGGSGFECSPLLCVLIILF